ncbi:UNVERIFIED_CONTAM: hypothetical protein Scaly_1303200 [Sesamum calycinum]|uniref:Uncharacterized protein n=1 Tax=Sesamum calycinum TaxID=2727403 RepID=A0AAW2Q781_9LAMI
MASEKRASEGIALLSMYGDEDDEMEDIDEEEENRHEEDIPAPESDAVTMKDIDGVSDFGNEMPGEQEETGLNDNSTPNKTFNYGTSSASATPQLSLFSPQQQQQQQAVGSDSNSLQSQKNRLTIVDYGHEEGAISPEAEEGEILAAGRVMYGEKLQAGDEADMRREMERREQERKKTQKLDFTSGGIQPGNVVPTPKISMPTPGLTAVATATSDVTARDGRQNKKSKWDKVDVDQRNSLATGGQENLSAVGAHAALLSVAKAGSGYSAFAFLDIEIYTMAGNREERRQKISDLVTGSWREDHRVVLLMLNLDVRTSIATDMKIKSVAVARILSLRPVLRGHTVDIAVYEAYLDNNIIPFKSFSSQSVLVDHSQNVIAKINTPAERKSCFP